MHSHGKIWSNERELCENIRSTSQEQFQKHNQKLESKQKVGHSLYAPV